MCRKNSSYLLGKSPEQISMFSDDSINKPIYENKDYKLKQAYKPSLPMEVFPHKYHVFYLQNF
jgi:hypothetical protein